MQSIYKTLVAIIFGFVAGALSIAALRAQPSSAPAFVIANVEDVKDAAIFAQYRTAAAKTEAAFGGHAIARGAGQKLDDSSPPKGEVVVIQFPSMKALKDWWSSREYTAVRPLREKSTTSHLFALEGLPPT